MKANKRSFGLTAKEIKQRRVVLPCFASLEWGEGQEELGRMVAGAFASGFLAEILRVGNKEPELAEEWLHGVGRRRRWNTVKGESRAFSDKVRAALVSAYIAKLAEEV